LSISILKPHGGRGRGERREAQQDTSYNMAQEKFGTTKRGKYLVTGPSYISF